MRSYLSFLVGLLLLLVQSRSLASVEIAMNADFPDPVIVRSQNGMYYAYATQSRLGDKKLAPIINIQLASSPDLKAWTYIGDALPTKPKWALNTQAFWAPHVLHDKGRYYMYYSAQPDLLAGYGGGLCLAIATSKKPTGPFIDKGSPLTCGTSFENIDPMAFDDPGSGKKFLYWGSGGQPIRVRELANNRMAFAPNSSEINLIYPDPADAPENYRKLIEASWVHKRGAYYYLFFSGSNCCNPDPHYGVLVARSLSPTGPFAVHGATAYKRNVLLSESKAYTAMGHNCLERDPEGALWIFFHGIERRRPDLKNPIPGDRDVRRILLKSQIFWRHRWPEVRIE